MNILKKINVTCLAIVIFSALAASLIGVLAAFCAAVVGAMLFGFGALTGHLGGGDIYRSGLFLMWAGSAVFWGLVFFRTKKGQFGHEENRIIWGHIKAASWCFFHPGTDIRTIYLRGETVKIYATRRPSHKVFYVREESQ